MADNDELVDYDEENEQEEAGKVGGWVGGFDDALVDCLYWRRGR